MAYDPKTGFSKGTFVGWQPGMRHEFTGGPGSSTGRWAPDGSGGIPSTTRAPAVPSGPVPAPAPTPAEATTPAVDPAVPSVQGINKVVSLPSGGGGAMSGGGGGGDVSASLSGMMTQMGPQQSGSMDAGIMLRSLGLRTKPTESMSLAGMGRRVY